MTPRLTRLRSSWLLPAVLSTTAGAVDVIGFLALGGLFTAHITGNVVIVAAHYVTGGFSQIGPLLAVPVFMAVMGLVTLASRALARAGTLPLRPLLLLETVLLAGFLLLGVGFGRFDNADSSMAVLAGMLGVSAMATQKRRRTRQSPKPGTHDVPPHSRVRRRLCRRGRLGSQVRFLGTGAASRP